jgi:aryl-alcohol dehydrogenase-like predicted oxidoreductase
VGFGALEIGRDWGMGDAERPAEADAIDVTRGVLDLGINILDTASAYLLSEERIGKAVPERRAEYFLASKCGEYSNLADQTTAYDFSYEAVSRSIDNSLALLKTDCIDLMQIHFGPDIQKVIDEGETVRAMKDAKAAGKIKALGASCDGDFARQCIESGDFDVMQMNYSLLDRGNEPNIASCAAKGIGVFVRTGLGRGKLTPKILREGELEVISGDSERAKLSALIELVGGDGNLLMALAIQFLHANPGVSSALLGSKSLAHVAHDLELAEMELPAGMLDKAISICS